MIEFPTPIPRASPSTRWPISFTAGASCACTAIKPSAITVPSIKRNPRALLEITPLLVPDVFLPVHGAEFVERAEDFVWQRHDHILDLARELADIDSLRRSFSGAAQ